jgi:oxaloacetate decarboxylase beta subunit
LQIQKPVPWRGGPACIFATFFGALFLGFNEQAASAIAIIGEPTAPRNIPYAKMANSTIGTQYMGIYGPFARDSNCGVFIYGAGSVIQPPIMKLLTTKKERLIRMEQLRPVSKKEKIVFPIIVTALTAFSFPRRFRL